MYMIYAPLIAIALAVLALLAYRASQIWRDSRQLGWHPARRLVWALWGALMPSSYWWDARVEALEQDDQDELLGAETDRLDVSRADALVCPLCGTEVPDAWTVDARGEPDVAPSPVECPQCDFRLDACRHCAHFLPGQPGDTGSLAVNAGDITSGRCGYYKTYQPVEQATTPDMARRLRSRGWDRVRAPRPIADSFLPPDSCRAFKADRRRLRAGGVAWPGSRRIALLRILETKRDDEKS